MFPLSRSRERLGRLKVDQDEGGSFFFRIVFFDESKFHWEIHSEIENFNFALNLMKCRILLQKRILSNLIQESNIFGIFFIVINEVYK